MSADTELLHDEVIRFDDKLKCKNMAQVVAVF